MNVAELVGQIVASQGAGHAFGVVGSGNFVVTNALRAHGVPFVATRHEAGAATMADAYSRMSGRLGVVSTHQGCGLTNALTGIGEAAKSRTPLLVLAADTAASAVLSNFAIDQDAVARAVGAVPERVHSAASAATDTLRACRTAVQERRTVVLNLPLDVQALPVAYGWSAGSVEPPVVRLPRPDAAAVEELVALILGARRPVFVAGRGARHAGAELRSLADASGALLATSAVANGLFHGDPWSLGISGGFATPLAASLISEADLIVGWGCALNMWTMRHGRLIGPSARVAQVDVDSFALGAHRPVDLGVVGDVARTATDVLAGLAARGPRADSGYREEAIRERLAREGRWRDVAYDDASTADQIDARTLSIRLDELLPAERVVAVDSGNFMGYPSAYLSVPDEYGFCFTQAFQSIGLGLSTAIGAALAQPARLPVAALGDGGFHMSIAELETAARLGLPLLVVVYNDAAYGAEVHHFRGPGSPPGKHSGPDDPNADLSTVRFPDTDIAAIGRGFGCSGLTVRKASDLDAVSDWLAGPKQAPLVVDAKLASDGGAWWLAEAFRGH